MKIYFGRNPKTENVQPYYIDIELIHTFGHSDSFEEAVDLLIEKHIKLDTEILYTLNPLFINFLDDDIAKKYVWYIDSNGNHVRFEDNIAFMDVLQYLNPGEAMLIDEVLKLRKD